MSEANGDTKVCMCCKKPIVKDGGRGTCRNCYQTLAVRIRQGQTTWDELIELGLCSQAREKNQSGLVAGIIEAARQAKANQPGSTPASS